MRKQTIIGTVIILGLLGACGGEESSSSEEIRADCEAMAVRTLEQCHVGFANAPYSCSAETADATTMQTEHYTNACIRQSKAIDINCYLTTPCDEIMAGACASNSSKERDRACLNLCMEEANACSRACSDEHAEDEAACADCSDQCDSASYECKQEC